MKYPSPLVLGSVVRRYKRYLIDVELADGTVVTAHCPNPGRMTSCLADGAPCRLQHAPSPKRKLAWTLEQVQIDGIWIGVHPRLANNVVAEGLADGVVPQFVDAQLIEREVVAGDSRVDFRVTMDDVPHWVEVKQVTLRAEDGMAAFPDAVTARGLKHIGELLRLVKDGGKASFLFAVAREDVTEVRPADEVDPAYCNALRAAAKQGVGVIAHRIIVAEDGLTLGASIPVIL